MTPWWRGAVIYQIYPRSFLDTNGDGIGDLAGIAKRLDYIEALGVDAIWLSPIFTSPDRDYGYDVADYCAIDPRYGTMAEFDELIKAVHGRGMKLILDQVLSHTSDRHPWFMDSIEGGTKRDWYVWADPKPDGTAPNNWTSSFGGAAWSYHPRRRQFYHHKFYREQPKLNLHHPEARKAVLDVLRYWLDRGVDGFRLDVANTYLHDRTLADNPAIPVKERNSKHWSHDSRMQRHLHDANRDENADVLREIRKISDDYPDSFIFGEFSEEPQMLPKFAGPDTLHSGYTFDFLEDRSFAPEVFKAYYDFLGQHKDVWPCVTFSNHDVVRTLTRYGGTEAGEAGDPHLAKLCLLLLLCLKGTVLLYQGEELGLAEADIPDRDMIRDPIGDLYYPYFKGRDGCRTPMPWQSDAPMAGFTSGTPWLPVSPAQVPLAGLDQADRPDSTLAFAKEVIAFRKAHPALVAGDMTVLHAKEGLLGFQREFEGERIACWFNLGQQPGIVPLSPASTMRQFGEIDLTAGQLGPLSALIYNPN